MTTVAMTRTSGHEQLDLLNLAPDAPDPDPRHVFGPRFICGYCQADDWRGQPIHRYCSTKGNRWSARAWWEITCQCTCRLTGPATYEGQSPSWLPT